MNLEVLGRPLRCHACPPDLTAHLLEQWSFPAHRLAPHPYAIDIVGAGVPEDAARGGAWERVIVRALQREVELAVAGEAARFEDHSGRMWAVFGPDGTRITLEVPGTPSGLLRTAVYVAVAEALRVSGVLPLHGAVARRGALVCAFLGPSGRGKSTTLLRALNAGWTALAEDFAWYDPATGCVHGWDRGLRLLPSSLLVLSESLAGREWPRHPDGKTWLPAAELRAHGVAWQEGGAHLSRVALLERDADRPSGWHGLEPRQAVGTLWEATGLPITRRSSHQTAQHIAGLVKTVELTRLHLGSTPLPL